MVKTYISLTKPGIIWGNIIAAIGGFLLASKGNPDYLLFAHVLMAVAFVVASGCVFNNIIDSDIDNLMERTKKRALVTNKISKHSAFLFGLVLIVIGVVLMYFINIYCLLFGILGFVVYVFLYSMYYKRSSVHGTLVGSFSGAAPPVMGYTAVSNEIDAATLLIFLGFCAWQMPHSFAIAIFRKQDYTSSNIPLLPLVKGLKRTQIQMIIYTLLFAMSVFGLFYLHYVGYIALSLIMAICGYWLYQTIVLYKPNDADFQEHIWGKKMFITSILAITIFSIVISVDYIA